MENLNAENIKRGLECCKGSYDCFTCDIYKRGCAGWRDGLAKDALALINSQEQRIGELEAECEQWRSDWEENQKQWEIAYDKLESENARLTEENERLQKHNAVLVEDNHILSSECIPMAKADTVRKMQERLKADAVTIQDHTGKLGVVVGVGNIDDVAREMLEGETDGDK